MPLPGSLTTTCTCSIAGLTSAFYMTRGSKRTREEGTRPLTYTTKRPHTDSEEAEMNKRQRVAAAHDSEYQSEDQQD